MVGVSTDGVDIQNLWGGEEAEKNTPLLLSPLYICPLSVQPKQIGSQLASNLKRI